MAVEEITLVLHISMRMIDRVKKRFVEEGLEAALGKKVGSRVFAKKADGDFESHLVALSCCEPPEDIICMDESPKQLISETRVPIERIRLPSRVKARLRGP